MRDIATRLLHKTKLRLVNWIQYNFDKTGCKLLLDKSFITINFVKPKAEGDYIKLSLVSSRSSTDIPSIAFMQAYTDYFDPRDETEQRDFDDAVLLKELYSEATKVAYRWDEVLADIDDALSNPGKIGLNDPHPATSALLEASTKEPANAPRR